MTETSDGNESEKQENDLPLLLQVFAWISFFVISLFVIFTMVYLLYESNDSGKSSSSESEETNVRQDVIGTYMHSSGGRLVVRGGGECYIHLQESDEDCNYDLYVSPSGRVEFDVEMLSRDLPGTGNALDGEYRDNRIILETMGKTFVYEKVR